jgi:hypothetical protein
MTYFGHLSHVRDAWAVTGLPMFGILNAFSDAFPLSNYLTHGILKVVPLGRHSSDRSRVADRTALRFCPSFFGFPFPNLNSTIAPHSYLTVQTRQCIATPLRLSWCIYPLGL